MDLARVSRRWLSPALFALIGICFLLPFGTVSCDGVETTFTGAELATWTVPDDGSADGADLAGQVEDKGSLLTLLTLLASMLGLLLGLLRMPWGEGWCAATGLVTTLVLGLQAANSLATTVHVGYGFTLLLFTCAAVLHAVRAVRGRRAAGRPAGSGP